MNNNKKRNDVEGKETAQQDIHRLLLCISYHMVSFILILFLIIIIIFNFSTPPYNDKTWLTQFDLSVDGDHLCYKVSCLIKLWYK